jgi:ribose transport system permease protein
MSDDALSEPPAVAEAASTPAATTPAAAADAVRADDAVVEATGWTRRLGSLRGATSIWLTLFIIALAIGFGIASALVYGTPVYLKVDNLLSIGLNAAQIMVLAMGMTYLIGAGHLDLSVGQSLILSSVLGAKVMVAVGGSSEQVAAGQYPNLGLAITLGVLTALAVGAAVGLLNGLIVTRLRLSSFIVTLGTSGIAYGVALVLTSAATVPFIPDQIQQNFGGLKLLGFLPAPLALALVVAAIMWWFLRRTRFGLRTLAIGSSKEAAIRAGVNVERHTTRLFVLMGVLVGIAAVIDLARNANTNVVGHQTDSLQAIAAVVLGGTSLFGGIASIGGSILGSLVPVMLQNGLVILQVQPFYQFVIVGIILILAVYFDQRRRERAI